MLRLQIRELYTHEGLTNLHDKFCKFLEKASKDLFLQLQSISDYDAGFALQLAPYIEEFIVDVFGLAEEVQALCKYENSFTNIHRCKRQFIQRYAVKNYDMVENFAEIELLLKQILNTDEIGEALYADQVMKWWLEKEKYQHELEIAAKYAIHMTKKLTDSALFGLPKKLYYEDLVTTDTYKDSNVAVLKSPVRKYRSGFKLTDKGLSSAQAIDQANYCIFCHKRGKDSCSKGIYEKSGECKISSSTKTKLTGCPLDEKISEMNLMKSQGYNIAALVFITLDNPMCAATGHRICNDCMRSCIYQKQTPVNIPGVETNILSLVLSLPYGFEIYSLLTRWNPLNFKNPIPKKSSNYKVLVVGLGPAGFTMAHYLLNEGHTVVAIDGLKIEKLPVYLAEKEKFVAIKDVTRLYEELDERVIAGFGGVTEYGITARWNKNYLKLVRLLLERRENFAMYGGIRFGSNITYKNAIQLGFNHIVLAIGAGSPNIVNLKNNLSCGVRMASDFLMLLQLGGAYKKDSITNLQIRMPIVVIGGGLTAVDTATEALYYYVAQVKKFTKQYSILGENFEKKLSQQEKEVAKEFLCHAKLLNNKSTDELSFLKSLGGVKILYRKTLQDSPAYRLNHEELEKAFAEGVEFIENFIPSEVLLDRYGNAKAILGSINKEKKVIAAKTILIAAGTKSNSILSREDPENFYDFINNPRDDITLLGDVNPKYSGSVVKAMASAKHTYSIVTKKLSKLTPEEGNGFFAEIDKALDAEVVDVIQLTPTIYEVVVRSKLASENFKPGQFYRLQNYEYNALKFDAMTMLTEGIALTGAKVEQGKISLITLVMGASSSLCSYLRPKEKIVLMGPTGTPTVIPKNETVMLIGGGLGNAVLFSVGQAMRKNGCKILYVAGYKKEQDRYKIEEIEKAADVIFWACDERKMGKTREQDFSFCGNIIDMVSAFHVEKKVVLSEIDRVLVIGSDSMMNAVNYAPWKKFFKKGIKIIASINSPMQCMMKGICAQCLQKHRETKTKEETFVYSCCNQDQDMNTVDFYHLQQRLRQNSLQEKVTANFIKCLCKFN